MAKRAKDRFITPFLKDEDGAVTADWVVLSAIVMGLAVLGGQAIGTAANTGAANVGTAMDAATE